MEDKKYQVLSNHTKDGRFIKIAKILAKNLTSDEAKNFIQNNQHKYKFPLQWISIPLEYNSNIDNEIFPISK